MQCNLRTVDNYKETKVKTVVVKIIAFMFSVLPIFKQKYNQTFKK